MEGKFRADFGGGDMFRPVDRGKAVQAAPSGEGKERMVHVLRAAKREGWV